MIVVDASVAFKWIKSRHETQVGEAYKLLELHLNKEQKIIIPNLLLIEVANALTTKSRASAKAIKIDLKKLSSLNLQIESLGEQDILRASLLAKKYKTSVYDMLYAVVAKEHGALLYTADANFVRKTSFKFAKHLSEVKV
ncbi:MAG: hypothetical protein COU69_01815 [Candidatus Pacebacteria bacterium CG10_big_fil_rev_8_21_14_0_10_56_10]|nr:MAG: hypothetical protein COU69_01815 [Candidatus Pacebacteria bacterium CG10_big_fil_rev_8_21_14_0_10_56_10]